MGARIRRNMSRSFTVLSAASCWFIMIAFSVLAEQTAITATGVLEEVFLPEGEIPKDNPFPGSPVYSYGHRNPQGLAWHPATEDLFISEHGPSGEFFKFANDEVNVIRKGSNYGWPEVIGRAEKEPHIDPLIVWKETTPPSGITFYKGDLFVATLRSNAIVKIELSTEKNGDYSYEVKQIERWFAEDFSKGEFGRIRDVVVGTDGYLYFLTSNRDGRGAPRANDDKIYRIVPKGLE